MPTLAHYAADDLPLALKYQLLAAVRIEWSWAFSGARALWDYTQKFTEPSYTLLSEQDVLISFAEINRRMLQIEGEVWQLAGLSAVYTFPAFRGHGFGSQVVQAATEYIRSQPADLALLFCQNTLGTWYTQQGWERCDSWTIHYGDPAAPTVATDSLPCAVFLSERAQQKHPLWEQQALYVGRYLW